MSSLGKWLGASFVALSFAIFPAAGQSTLQQREMHAILGGGPPGGPGKCTLEVLVDQRAEVEIQQDSALLRRLAGERPQWKRYDCTSLMPLQPAGFKLMKINGRGRMKLTLDPTHGGPAVIEIDDNMPGVGDYIFEISWTAPRADKPLSGYAPDLNKELEADRKKPPEIVEPKAKTELGFVRPFVSDEAVRACEDVSIDRAIERFHAQAVAIRKSAVDTTPGREEWVVGNLETRRGKQWDAYHFSCSVDFRERKIRSVDLDATGSRK